MNSQRVRDGNLVKFPGFNGTAYWFHICKDYFQRSIIADRRLPKLPDFPIGLVLPFKFTPSSIDHDENVQLYFRKNWNIDADMKYLKLRGLAYKLSQLDACLAEDSGRELENDAQPTKNNPETSVNELSMDLEVADSTSASRSVEEGVVRRPSPNKNSYVKVSSGLTTVEATEAETGNTSENSVKLKEAQMMQEPLGTDPVSLKENSDTQLVPTVESQKSATLLLQKADIKTFPEGFSQIDKPILTEKSETEKVPQNSVSTKSFGYISVDRMLDAMVEELSELKCSIHDTMHSMKHAFRRCYDDEHELFNDNFRNQPHYDIYCVSNVELQYARMLESCKHLRHKQLLYRDSRETLKSDELYVCQVCNVGDSSEVDEIVFCSRCNITVHEACARVKVDHNADWLCEVCKHFEANGRYLSCALCTRRGGIMKETTTHVDDPILSSLNPAYCADRALHSIKATKAGADNEASRFVKTGGKSKRENEHYHIKERENIITAHDQEKFSEFYEKLYYNFFKEPANYEGIR